jgi:protein-S-isoprenylcysteine O-methyltransferase Ste14
VRAGRVVLVVLFGFVLLYLPARLFGSVLRPTGIGPLRAAGTIAGIAGAVLALWCVLSFAAAGGTPAPFAPPRRLVSAGPYRFVRNPMYIGVGLFLAGAAAYYDSLPLAAYVAAFFLASHLFVVWYEEPTLREAFGRDYTAYTGRVNRWRPGCPG